MGQSIPLLPSGVFSEMVRKTFSSVHYVLVFSSVAEGTSSKLGDIPSDV